MDNSNITNEKKNVLESILERLYLLCYTKTSFSQIEKDILLQNLREAYMAILIMQTDETGDSEQATDDSLQLAGVSEQVTTGEEKPLVVAEEEVPFSSEEPLVAEEEVSLSPEKPLVVEEEVSLSPEEPLVVEEEVPLSSEEPLVAEEKEFSETSLFFEEDIIVKIEEPEVCYTPHATPHEIEEVVEPEPELTSHLSPHEIEIEPEVCLTSHVSHHETTIPKRSLNDLFSEKREERSLNARFSNEKITDLTKSISINDKFLFIRELFNNKGEEFSRSLQILNSCEDIESTFEKMEEMKKNYYWDSTSSAYLKLCDLIRRKF